VSRSDLSEFSAFVVTGGVAAMVNIATRWLFEWVVSYEAAIAMAYLCGMVTAFLLARLFVFKAANGSMHGQFTRFALVNAVALVQVMLVSVALVRLVFPAIGFSWQAETVGHVIGVLSPVVTSYLMHKHFSFRTAST
jgi:putative flippase GtrA